MSSSPCASCWPVDPPSCWYSGTDRATWSPNSGTWSITCWRPSCCCVYVPTSTSTMSGKDQGDEEEEEEEGTTWPRHTGNSAWKKTKRWTNGERHTWLKKERNSYVNLNEFPTSADRKLGRDSIGSDGMKTRLASSSSNPAQTHDDFTVVEIMM